MRSCFALRDCPDRILERPAAVRDYATEHSGAPRSGTLGALVAVEKLDELPRAALATSGV